MWWGLCKSFCGKHVVHTKLDIQVSKKSGIHRYAGSVQLCYNLNMAGTKILNVQKSDSFDEVFDAFKQAEAQEVIFIFPKGSVFAQDASYFETIKKESEATGKTVNVMSSDPLIAHLATQNGLGVLQNPAPKTRRVAPRSIPEPEPQQPVQEVATPEQGAPHYSMAQEAAANLESALIADPTMARKAKPAPQLRKSIPPPMITPSGRRIRDIVSGDQDTSLDVEQEKEKDVEVEISRTSVIPLFITCSYSIHIGLDTA